MPDGLATLDELNPQPGEVVEYVRQHDGESFPHTIHRVEDGRYYYGPGEEEDLESWAPYWRFKVKQREVKIKRGFAKWINKLEKENI